MFLKNRSKSGRIYIKVTSMIKRFIRKDRAQSHEVLTSECEVDL